MGIFDTPNRFAVEPLSGSDPSLVAATKKKGGARPPQGGPCLLMSSITLARGSFHTCKVFSSSCTTKTWV